ncbi:ABC-F family ATP-binding cassette domain-containing protein [Cryptosporangium japonicum]|uniref:ABC-F family ATP-binding cassette domain-containing protein n=1 Tax=Cryptosporangium japonicum TaxID=80872 RepID=A0ABN0UQI5_9ACTN
MAANLVNLETVSVSLGTRTLLDQVSLGVGEAERIGVVGLNGAGKSTLLRVLTKEYQPDSGRVTQRGDLRLGHLTQSVNFADDAIVRDIVIGGSFDAEHEWAGDARIRTVLDGLGLNSIGLDAPVAKLSGGERRRVALAALLIKDTDLLVLDEPTNHLDVEGVAWLAEHLKSKRGGLLVVTHDRWFLDAVCTRTWEVTEGRVEQYEGGYAAWVLARAERSRQAAAAEERRQNLMRKELAWLRRGAPARTSKPKFRIEAANALIADVPEPRDTVQLKRLAGTRIGKQVYDVEDVSLRFGERTILNRVTWRIGPGDRFALVGVNGAGKTTLLRLLAEQNEPDSGEVKVGKTVKAAYLSQEVTELPPTLRVLQAVEEVAQRLTVGDRDLTASQLAEMFGFSSARQWTPVGDLSGGERRRLQLLRLLMAGPNVLLLDEPTNDLDIDTLQALEDLLDSWPGTLVVVSHDRYLVERVTDQVWALLGDGALRMLTGGIDEYLERRAAAGSGTGRPTTAAPVATASAEPTSSAADQRAAKKELSRLERQISKLEERERKLHDRLAENATDFAKVAELDAELRTLQAEREAAEESWLELSESV